jgi:uncharacterized protein (DUF362 family)
MMNKHSRRHFIRTVGGLTLGVMGGATVFSSSILKPELPVVSIVRIKDDHIDYAVEKAIDLLGGLETVAKNKDRILLKPNLVAESPTFTTKPTVIRSLAHLMKNAGKEVWIGEGSATGTGFNFKNDKLFRTRKEEILNPMQEYVFDVLGYTELAKAEHIPLINLHTGNLVDVQIPDGLVFNQITLHESLLDIDLLCSVPMMKTHTLATVTLGMKNLIGLYPGKIYCSVRSCLHDDAFNAGSSGISFEILDMVHANKLGLTVIDGSMAMEGNGPSDGVLVKMDVIIAGTNPLATDMVAARVMGFEPYEIPTFATAFEHGMTPSTLKDIEIRGESIDSVERKFIRPVVYSWKDVSPVWGNEEI